MTASAHISACAVHTSKHAKTVVLSKPKEDNSYYQADPGMFDQLLQLVIENPASYSLKLNAKGRRREANPVLKYKKLNEWIDKVTTFKLSDPFYKTPTKCYWILHDLHDFPACAGCGKNDGFMHANVHLQSGYPRNCSVKCRQHDPMTLKHRRSTCMLKFGVENPFQSEDVKKKCEDTKRERYGDSHFTNAVKAKQTFSKHKSEDPEFLAKGHAKRKQTSLQRFGYENPAQCPEIAARMHKKYMFDGMMFDSSCEIAYFIYMRHLGHDLQRSSKTFTYEFNGKTCCYIPDFWNLSTEEFIEVKGSHFFKAHDGTMTIPWRHPSWTDEEWLARCQKEEAKHQCMISNNVHIVLDNSPEMADAVEYVKKTYGKSFLSSLRYQKELKER